MAKQSSSASLQSLVSRSSEKLDLQIMSPAVLHDMVEMIQFFYQQGWCPATSSNFSCRLPEQEHRIYISVSGRDKSQVSTTDFLEMDLQGQIKQRFYPSHQPSAETWLHLMVYQQYPQAQAVFHTHSHAATVLSKLYAMQHQVVFNDFEILKGLDGIHTHQTEFRLPIFDNDQDIPDLAQRIAKACQTTLISHGFLLAGHGLYCWGKSLQEAKRHVETLEFLLACYLELCRHGYFKLP